MEVKKKVTLVGVQRSIALLAAVACLAVVGASAPSHPAFAQGTADDVAADTTTTAVATVDDGSGAAVLFRGTIDTAGDVDWIKVALTEDQMYRFALKGSTTGSTRTLRTPVIRGIYKGADQYVPGTTSFLDLVYLVISDFQNRDARLHYFADKTGDHWVSVAGLNDEAGTYDLRVLEVDDDKQPDNSSTPASIRVGRTAGGTINYRGDSDWFETTLVGGDEYQVDVADRNPNSYLASRTTLYNSSGTSVDHTRRVNSSQRAYYTPSSSGTYYIAVHSWLNRSGGYDLTLITSSSPNFSFIGSLVREVPEGTAAGNNIGQPLVATGPNGGATSYTLGGTDGSSFSIVSATGQLQTVAALVFATKSSYEVSVTATDSEANTVTADVTIQVTRAGGI